MTVVRRLLPLALAMAVAAGCSAETATPTGTGIPDDAEPAQVVRVVDGDTVILRGEGGGVLPDADTRVRLLEIDAPESVAPDRPVECFGPEASQGLERLLPERARVWVQRDEELVDPFDRVLLYVWTDEGDFVNLEMVRSGLAEAVLFEPNDRWIDEVRAAEQEARTGGRGLWGAC